MFRLAEEKTQADNLMARVLRLKALRGRAAHASLVPE